MYLAVAVTPTVLFRAVLRLTPVAGAALESLSRRPRPVAPALEAAVGHLRRLRREVRGRTQRTRLRRRSPLPPAPTARSPGRSPRRRSRTPGSRSTRLRVVRLRVVLPPHDPAAVKYRFTERERGGHFPR